MTTVVLNGASSAGKSSLAAALQAAWDGPLQASGLDTFLAVQSDAFFGGPGADGMAWTPSQRDGEHVYEVVPGPRGEALLRAAWAFWRACADEGLDQVVDDVWLTERQSTGLRAALAGCDVLWVGVHCPVEVLVQRERDRGDRRIGQTRAQSEVVHTWSAYDLEVDTSLLSPEQAAQRVLRALGR